MARKTKEEIERLKKKYNVDTIWSWSRYNCYKNSPYEYYLKYIIKEPKDRADGIYGTSGNLCHNILEDFYEDKIKYEDMINKYESGLFDMEMANLKYDRTDEDKNNAIAYKYENSIREFFKNHQIIQNKMMIEQFVIIKIGKHIVQGYIDSLFKKDDICYILDWKTSSIYKGEKINKESGQLKLYTLALVQKGVPIEKIRFGWNFLKYINLTYSQKNGKIKTTQIMRYENWMEKPMIKKNILSNAKDLKFDEDKIESLIIDGDYQSLPEELKSQYKIEDCYVWIQPTKEMLKELQDDIISTIEEIKSKGEDEKHFMEEVTDKQSYYFYNLCEYSRLKHKPFDEYLKNIEMFLEDEEDDILNL